MHTPPILRPLKLLNFNNSSASLAVTCSKLNAYMYVYVYVFLCAFLHMYVCTYREWLYISVSLFSLRNLRYMTNWTWLFRALKKKHATPTLGLIFNASLSGQAALKPKGKFSCSLAAKFALAIWYDALSDREDSTWRLENRAEAV